MNISEIVSKYVQDFSSKECEVVFFNNTIKKINFMKCLKKFDFDFADSYLQAMLVHYDDQKNSIKIRTEMKGIDNINNNLSGETAYKTMINWASRREPNCESMIKTFNKNDCAESLNYPFYIKISSEEIIQQTEFIKKLIKFKENHYKDAKNIFRYKEKYTKIFDFKDYSIILDLASVVHSDLLMNFKNNNYYTCEIELKINKNKSFNIKDIIKNFENIISRVFCALYDSEIMYTMDEAKNLQIPKNNSKHPVTFTKEMIASSLDIHLNYTITDKKDGEYSFLIINSNGVFSINDTINKFDVNVTSKETIILEGECFVDLITNKKRFVAFDIIDDNPILLERYSKLLNVIYELFKIKLPLLNPVETYMSLISDTKNYIIPAFYIFPTKTNWNFYKNCSDVWKQLSFNKNYNIDGLIFTPKISSNPILKWKPVELNSIDFYIEFIRDVSNNIKYVYDINEEETLYYVVARIYVYKIVNNVNVRIPFKFFEHSSINIIVDKETKTICSLDGEIIDDKTIIECVYIQNTSNPKFNWKILRTRHDKIENIANGKYGNSEFVALKVFNSIINPPTMQLFDELSSSPEKFQEIYEYISKHTTSEEIKLLNKTYYDNIFTRDFCTTMRDFHNLIKTFMIYSYLQNNPTVLDLGYGKGGDLHKYVHIKPKILIGIDYSYSNLFSNNDSAVSRLASIKGSQKINASFYLGDCGKFLISREQLLTPGMTKKMYDDLVQQLTKKQFDVICIMFSIHFMFKNDDSLTGLINNINTFLKPGGLVLITYIDGELLNNKFQNNNEYFEVYENKSIFHFKKKYNSTNLNKSGLEYLYQSDTISSEFNNEYIVTTNHLNQIMKKANCMLYESLSFLEVFRLYKLFLLDVCKNESREQTQKPMLRWARYYEDTIENQKCLKLTELNRFSIFIKNNPKLN